MGATAASSIVRHARSAAGLTQRALAACAGEHQPNIAAIESGARDAHFRTVAHLVDAAGARLCVLPTTSHTVAETADEVALYVERGDDRRAFRACIGMHDDLVRAEPATRVALCLTRPRSVGDERFDGLIAAIVEHDLASDGLPAPKWTAEPDRNAHGWWVEELPEMRDAVRGATPAAFVRHGIWLAASELESL